MVWLEVLDTEGTKSSPYCKNLKNPSLLCRSLEGYLLLGMCSTWVLGKLNILSPGKEQQCKLPAARPSAALLELPAYQSLNCSEYKITLSCFVRRKNVFLFSKRVTRITFRSDKNPNSVLIMETVGKRELFIYQESWQSGMERDVKFPQDAQEEGQYSILQ